MRAFGSGMWCGAAIGVAFVLGTFSACGGKGPSEGDAEAAIARFEARHAPWKTRMDEQMRDSLGGLNRGNLTGAQAGLQASAALRRQANEELAAFVRGEPILMALGTCLVARQSRDRDGAPSFDRINWSSLGMPTELRALAAEAAVAATIEPGSRTASMCAWPEGL